jgi:predicted nucleotide-binding protein (sugar kinase/HSP70/actin superfamily)
MNLANRCRPYEKNHGTVDVFVQVWIEKLQTERKPKVGIVGEILVNYKNVPSVILLQEKSVVSRVHRRKSYNIPVSFPNSGSSAITNLPKPKIC